MYMIYDHQNFPPLRDIHSPQYRSIILIKVFLQMLAFWREYYLVLLELYDIKFLSLMNSIARYILLSNLRII